ncbi:tetratricopeptide repeat protein [Opitutus sp. GAS368]|uniref:tetratricopeptide repeat protein n=1 Tax=Opitutus sp. GAS368 TaxID=1882749 RepID=UPI00087AB2CE|nr:tetratricopeptide repeat protein [Opitutus sp. GAS368]SDR73228.1 Tetratricopeptide (TPR) repeat [Opitutus sp. GAS368]
MNVPPPSSASARRAIWLAASGLVLAALAAYHNSFAGPFVFDDVPAIVDNPSIRPGWSLGGVLAPGLDGGLTVSGRPLVNLSLALNQSLGGEAVRGYHLVNLLIHVLAGLALFGIVRRTLAGLPGRSLLAGDSGRNAIPGAPESPASRLLQRDATWLALAVALLWTLHPLQTESVTYVVQRAESLMALCYLLTLYAFIRMAEKPETGRSVRRGDGEANLKPESRLWTGISIVACLAGMASKEVMASAPLMVLLYDRTFVAGSFREAWRRRWRYYSGLAATWLLLAWLVAGTTGRGGTAGFGAEVGPWRYLLTQCQAIIHYLWLVVWPDPLVFDYGTATVGGLGEVWLQALLLVALAAGTGVALVRRPVWGFAGAWFFLILAPSSSVVPVATQTVAEHRMYLPLVAILGPAVLGLYAWLGRRGLVVCGALAVGWGGLTVRRNADYGSEPGLWADTVAKRPANGRAHNNLGKAFFAANRFAEAQAQYEEAVRLQPGVPEPHYNLGLALARLGRPAEASNQYEEALRLQPNYAEAHNNLGNALLAGGRLEEAAVHYAEAVRLKPGFAEAHSNLANVRLEQGRGAEALREGEEAVRLDPNYAEARYNLGNALAQARRLPAALGQYEEALRLKPDYADVANNLGNVRAELGRLPEAIAAYERALELDPGYPDARHNLARVLIHLGRLPEAIDRYRQLAGARPDDSAIRSELEELQKLAH